MEAHLTLKSKPDTYLLVVSVVKSWILFSSQAYFDEGDYIVRQGATGDTMYIMSKGKVTLDFCFILMHMWQC